MGIPEVVIKKKKKKSILSRVFGYDLFLSFTIIFALLWFLPDQLVNNLLPSAGFVVPDIVRVWFLIFAFWMQLLAIACFFIFALSLLQKLGKGRRKKSQIVRIRRVPTSPAVPPDRVEKHNEYLAEAIKQEAESQIQTVTEKKK